MVDNTHLAQEKQIELKKKELEKEKESKLNVLVYGSDQLSYPYDSGYTIENEFYNVMFYKLANSESPPFIEFDIVVIHYGVFLSSGSPSYNCYEAELTKRKKEMVEFLKKKGTTACFLISKVGDNPIVLRDKDLVIDFLLRYKIQPSPLAVDREDIHANRGEFKRFLEKYGIARNNLAYSDDSYKQLCSTGNEVHGVGIQSKLICLPYHFTDVSRKDRISEFITTLVDCVLSYKAKTYYELPVWVSDFSFKKELPLIEDKKEIQRELENLEKRIMEFERYKRLLFLGDDELKNEVKNALGEGFGFIVGDIEKFIEDLLIKDSKNNPIVLVEVKGLNGNVKIADVSQLVTHRDRNDLTLEFPALLITNTMMKATSSIKDKEEDINPDIVKHSVNNNVLVIRTLDLLRVLDLILSKRLEAPKFLEIVKTRNGWLKVDDGKLKIMSPDEEIIEV